MIATTLPCIRMHCQFGLEMLDMYLNSFKLFNFSLKMPSIITLIMRISLKLCVSAQINTLFIIFLILFSRFTDSLTYEFFSKIPPYSLCQLRFYTDHTDSVFPLSLNSVLKMIIDYGKPLQCMPDDKILHCKIDNLHQNSRFYIDFNITAQTEHVKHTSYTLQTRYVIQEHENYPLQEHHTIDFPYLVQTAILSHKTSRTSFSTRDGFPQRRFTKACTHFNIFFVPITQ